MFVKRAGLIIRLRVDSLKVLFARKRTLYRARRKHNLACKRLAVRCCVCLARSLWWVRFNGIWQQLNSLAPFGGPLFILCFFCLPNSGPTSRLSPLCYRFSVIKKRFFFTILYKGKVFPLPVRLKPKCLLALCLCMYVCKWSGEVSTSPQPVKRSWASLVCGSCKVLLKMIVNLL